MKPEMALQNIMQVMVDILDKMHMVCLAFALLLILLSVYRQYSQFGEFLGLKYMAGVLLTIVLIGLFPEVSDYLFRAMLKWGRQVTAEAEAVMKVLFDIEIDGAWYDSIVVGISSVMYKGGIWIGRFIREIMVIVLCGLFLILKTLSPIFIAMLAVPETKSVAINFLTVAFGLVMTPLCMLFGDLTMIWVAAQMWEQTGMLVAVTAATGSLAGGAVGGSLTVLASSPPGAITVAAGAAGALIAFVCVFVLLCVVMYVGIPWACISLFRGAGIGNALAMSLNTASNVMAVVRTGQTAARSAPGGLGTVSKALHAKGAAANPAGAVGAGRSPAGREEA